MPNANSQARVLVRDRFHCRYCEHPLYFAQAIKVLDMLDPNLQLWDSHGKKLPLKSYWAIRRSPR